jgi:hypothetical protein
MVAPSGLSDPHGERYPTMSTRTALHHPGSEVAKGLPGKSHHSASAMRARTPVRCRATHTVAVSPVRTHTRPSDGQQKNPRMDTPTMRTSRNARAPAPPLPTIPASAVVGLPGRRVSRRGPALRVARGKDIRVLRSSPPRYATVGEAPPALSGCSAKVAFPSHLFQSPMRRCVLRLPPLKKTCRQLPAVGRALKLPAAGRVS